jgi:hypothetical protein
MHSDQRSVYFYDLVVTTNKKKAATPPPMAEIVKALSDRVAEKKAVHPISAKGRSWRSPTSG